MSTGLTNRFDFVVIIYISVSKGPFWGYLWLLLSTLYWRVAAVKLDRRVAWQGIFSCVGLLRKLLLPHGHWEKVFIFMPKWSTGRIQMSIKYGGVEAAGLTGWSIPAPQN